MEGDSASEVQGMTEHVGNIVDLHTRRVFAGRVIVRDGRIDSVCEDASVDDPTFLILGFVDAHVHIESSMLPPAEFGRIALRHGTVATVSDPHEIANVLGVPGIEFMFESAEQTPLKICFGVPSCVPATAFETAGAVIGVAEVRQLLADPRTGYLSEMMNYPGVLNADPEVMAKIQCARDAGKPVDGHAPGLRGKDAATYAAAGIQTDHECVSLEEAEDKIRSGMLIAIREGSAARNFAALEPLLKSHPDHCMFCTDDMHPNQLVHGHVDRLVARAVAGGADVFDVLDAASRTAINHYRLPVGQLQPGDPADFIRVQDLIDFQVLETWIDGECVGRNGKSLTEHQPGRAPNFFSTSSVRAESFQVPAPAERCRVRVIDAVDGQLITGLLEVELAAEDGFLKSDLVQDIIKLAVINRYQDAPVSVGFLRGFGLKRGAIASSVAHDSHNVLIAGVDDASMAAAANAVIAARGGVCACSPGQRPDLFPLEIAGLMSTMNGDDAAVRYEAVAESARRLGTNLRDPFMTLSFMALLVIPDLKLGDLGLFSGAAFSFVPLVINEETPGTR